MIGFQAIDCGGCSITYHVPKFWLDDKRKTGKNFHCPNGCVRCFRDTDEDKLRRERDLLKQRLAEKDDDIKRQRENAATAWRSASAHKGQVTKLRNRAKAGVCPCCNRSFQNLKRHMSSKHPDFGTAELEVIDGGKVAS